MRFIVVSRRSLIRELVSNYFSDQGFSIAGTFDHLSDIPDTPNTATVILHVSTGDSVTNLSIDSFHARHPNSQIILLCSKVMRDEVTRQLSSKVEAIILDDSSLRALTGLMTVVQEGFRLTPSRDDATSDLAEPQSDQSAAEQPPVSAAARLETNGPGASPLHDNPTASAEFAPTAESASKLSIREKAVIRKLREGASNKDIAKDLHIGESTVKVHLRSCYRKIGVRNRTQAAIWVSRYLPQ